MAGMTGKDIERRLRRMEETTSRDLDARILGLLGDAAPLAPPVASRRRALRFAAGFAGAGAIAAALVLAALFARPEKWGGQTASAAETLQRAVEASKKARWAHVKIVSGEEQGEETWWSLKPLRMFHKDERGITGEDVDKREQYRYERATNTLTISSLVTGDSKVMEGADNYFDAMMKFLEYEGAQTSKVTEKADGRTLELVAGVSKSMVWRVYIEPETKRIVRMETEMKNRDGSPRKSVYEFDYPEAGPADVYALGVPTDARVVDRRRPAAVGLYKAAVEAKARFADGYFAIVCYKTRQKDGTYRPSLFYVVYKSRGRYRLENYGASAAYFGSGWSRRIDRFDSEDISVVEEELKTGTPVKVYFGSDKSRAAQHVSRDRSDGSDGSLVVRDWGDGWKDYTPEGINWRRLPRGLERVTGVEEKEGPFGRLRALVETRQGSVRDGKVNTEPQRCWWYLNPGRDHIVEEYVSLYDGEADWQEDKNWLDGVEGADQVRRQRRRNSSRVTQYAQTETGKWYAKKTVTEDVNPDTGKSHRSLWLVLIDTTRVIPDEVFDVSKVKAEDLLDVR